MLLCLRLRMRGNWFAGVGLLLVILLIFYYYLPGWLWSPSRHGGPYASSPRAWLALPDIPPTMPVFTFATYNVRNDDMLKYGDKKNPCNRYPEFRNITVRQENLLRDMDQLKAEVACMQELDTDWFRDFWHPRMFTRGYDGVFGAYNAAHDSHTGVGIFWKKEKFNLALHEQHYYKDLVKRYVENTLEGEEAAAFTSWFGLKHALLLAELNDVTSGAKVIVGCTHISANHKLPARQTLQVTLALQKLKAFSEVRGVPNLVLAGDFNSAPQHPVHDVIRTGSVSKESRSRLDTMTDWENLPPEEQRFAVKVLDLMPTAFTHDLKMHSAYFTAKGREPLTTCWESETLDYILYSYDHVGVAGVLELPDGARALREKRPEACVHFPSDHLPLKAQLYFVPPAT